MLPPLLMTRCHRLSDAAVRVRVGDGRQRHHRRLRLPHVDAVRHGHVHGLLSCPLLQVLLPRVLQEEQEQDQEEVKC